MTHGAATSETKWKALRGDIAHRITLPFQHPELAIYFTFFVLGAGHLGTWVEVFRPMMTSEGYTSSAVIQMSRAAAGASLSLCGPMLVHLAIARLARAITVLSIGLVSAGIILSFVTFILPHPRATLATGIIASLLCLGLWWVLNPTGSVVEDEPSLSAATGGDVSTELEGSTADFAL
ncbi:hypothetical protein [Vulgatibacter sp.]|uniref:hypothetical protein n=1 Tax=Vulgatibacter sp. TaxID=1971226 RepID=UPI00356A549E